MLKTIHALNGPTIQQEQGATDAVGGWLAHSATAQAHALCALSQCARERSVPFQPARLSLELPPGQNRELDSESGIP